MRNEKLHQLTRIAMLGTVGFLLMFFLHFPVPGFASFLKYDPGDVPGVIAGYTMGPAAGVTVQVVKGLIWLASGRSAEGWVGVLANILAGSSLVLASSLMHRLLERAGNKHWAWGLLSAAAGTIFMAALLIPLNALLVYPLWGMKGAAAWQGALALSTPFNLFKGFISSVISVAFYRRLQPFLVVQPQSKTA